MFKKAALLFIQIDAAHLVTGEVLNQRPFSQRRDTMTLIDREAGVEGQILRQLSGQLLPKTALEQQGLIDRASLYPFHERRWTPQMQLARNLGIKVVSAIFFAGYLGSSILYPDIICSFFKTDKDIWGRIRDN